MLDEGLNIMGKSTENGVVMRDGNTARRCIYA